MQETDMLKRLQKEVASFIEERDWKQFQTPKNVATNIAVEAAELLEFFIWCEGAESHAIFNNNRKDIEHEVADIMISLLTFCLHTDINLAQAVTAKLKIIKKKYPVEKIKGCHSAYYKIKLKKHKQALQG